jgi:Domain of unknown function (DUF3576)
MMFARRAAQGITLVSLILVSACSGGGTGSLGSVGSGPFSGGGKNQPQPKAEPERESTIWDLFGNADDPNSTVAVNKYIWNASLDVLNFLPIESVDPFGGVIVTGFGSPPGGGPAYRATIYVQDPALDARSLKLSLVTRNGPASAATIKAVEDAILTRARQLRIADGKL